eukprot:UN13460
MLEKTMRNEKRKLKITLNKKHSLSRSQNVRHRHRHVPEQTPKKVFEIGAKICICKHSEGLGFIKQTGDKNSYLIAFKNGKYGWYRNTKINLISDQE